MATPPVTMVTLLNTITSLSTMIALRLVPPVFGRMEFVSCQVVAVEKKIFL